MMSQAETPGRDGNDPSGFINSEVDGGVHRTENESGATSQAHTNYNVKWDKLLDMAQTLDTVEELNEFVNNLPYIKNTDEGKAIVERAHALAPPRKSTLAAPRSIDVSQQEQLSVEDLYQFAQNLNTKTDNELRSVLSSISNSGEKEFQVCVLLLETVLTRRMRERENLLEKELLTRLHTVQKVLVSYVIAVTRRASLVKQYLRNFAGLSQETKGTTTGKRKSDQITKSSSVRPQNNEGGLNQNPPELVCIEAESNIQMVKNIFKYVGDLDGYSQIELTEDESDYEDIRECMQFYNRCFEKAEFGKVAETGDHQPTVNLFKKFAAYKREQRQKEIKKKPIDDWFINSNLTLHGPTCGEVRWVQPLFEALLRSISAGLPFACEHESGLGSPKKGFVSPQVKMKEKDNSVRTPDIVLWSRDKHLAVMDGGTMKLTFEFKPGQRGDEGPITLYKQARNQGLSHAAKFLKKAFDFGPGVAAHCTFVVATPVYIQVMKLFLEKPGTPKCDVKLRSSKMLPLVSKTNFERYFRSDSDVIYENQVEKLKERIYTNELCNDPEKLAFLAIRKLMKSSRQDLVGIKMDGIELIGCGTFGTILVPKDEDVNGVLKVAKFGCEEVLLQELNMLKFLRRFEGNMLAGDANVIKLDKFGSRTIDFGGTKMQIPLCLQLSPRGVSAYSLSATKLKEKTSMIANDLKLGLYFIHHHGIVHNDISLQNFVLVPCTNGTNGKDEAERAVIIDLGSAERENVKMSGRVGTPDFAHKDYFELSCISRRECDLASLAFVIHVVHNGGVTPWTPIDYFDEERDDMTKEWFRRTSNEAGLTDNMKDYLIQCIDFSSNDRETEAER